MLTPSFMVLFNNSQLKPITDQFGDAVPNIDLGATTSDAGHIAESAFYICKIANERGLRIADALRIVSLRTEASELALHWIQGARRSPIGSTVLDEIGWQQVEALCETYSHFLDAQPIKSFEFSPRLKGSGFLGECQADLSIGQHLFEIKTVTRNFSASDIRQLVVYLALDHANGKRRWKFLGLLNPRRGIYADISVDYILFRLSGGRSAPEVLDDVLKLLSARGMVADAKF
jgi:hypothetical protein